MVPGRRSAETRDLDELEPEKTNVAVDRAVRRSGTPGGTRTPNLLIRSQALYPN